MNERRFIIILVALAATACGSSGSPTPKAGPAANPEQSTILGTIDGVGVDLAQLDEDAKSRLRDFDNESAQRRLHLLWIAFEDALASQLLEREAKQRGVTVEALLAEAEGGVRAPSDDEVRAIYDANSEAIGVPFEQALEPLRAQMMEQSREDAQRGLVERLRQQADVRYALPVPELPRYPSDAGSGPAAGPEDSRVTLLIFSDYECPYCAQARRVVDELERRYPNKLRIMHRDFPLSQHPHAQLAAEAAHCAYEQQKFWAYHAKLFDNVNALASEDLARYAKEVELDVEEFERCRASERPRKAVRAQQEAGRRLGVQGTPAIFLNGIKLIGLLPLPVLQALIESELDRQG